MQDGCKLDPLQPKHAFATLNSGNSAWRGLGTEESLGGILSHLSCRLGREMDGLDFLKNKALFMFRYYELQHCV